MTDFFCCPASLSVSYIIVKTLATRKRKRRGKMESTSILELRMKDSKVAGEKRPLRSFCCSWQAELWILLKSPWSIMDSFWPRHQATVSLLVITTLFPRSLSEYSFLSTSVVWAESYRRSRNFPKSPVWVIFQEGTLSSRVPLCENLSRGNHWWSHRAAEHVARKEARKEALIETTKIPHEELDVSPRSQCFTDVSYWTAINTQPVSFLFA